MLEDGRWTVFSKENCPYCVQAKKMLDKYKLPYKEYVVGIDVTRDQVLELAPESKTVPQIFCGKQYIGGFKELSEYTGFLDGFLKHKQPVDSTPSSFNKG